MRNLKEKALFVWRIPTFPVLFLINTILGFSTSFFIPFSSLFGIDEVGMSNAGFGVFMTVLALGGVVISSSIAKRSDTKLSRRKLLLITTLTGVIGYALFAFLRNYIALSLTAFFLLGASAAAVPQLWAYARDALKDSNIPAEQTPFIMNIFRMFFALAWTVGPALGAWLLILIDFQGLFLFVAAGYLLAFLTTWFLLKDVPKQQVVNKEALSVKSSLTKSHILANLAAALCLSAATSIHMLNVPQFVTKVLHGSEMDVGLIFSVPPVFEVPMMIGLGLLATRMDVSLLVKLGFITAFTYFLLFNFVTEPWQIYPLQILSAAQVSITGGIAISYFQDFMPEAPGTATTLYMNTTQIGSTVGYLLFGLISEVINYDHMIAVYTLFAGFACLCMVLYGKERKIATPAHSNAQGL